MLCLFCSSLAAEPLPVGADAPAVEARDHTGAPINLGERLATGTVLVFFYPKAHTPGCTAQACSLRDAWDTLREREVAVYGVSSDKPKAQAAFKTKHKLPFTLIADPERKVMRAFGKGAWSRQAYLFRDGKLVWRDLKAATKNQAAEALAALDALEAGGASEK